MINFGIMFVLFFVQLGAVAVAEEEGFLTKDWGNLTEYALADIELESPQKQYLQDPENAIFRVSIANQDARIIWVANLPAWILDYLMRWRVPYFYKEQLVYRTFTFWFSEISPKLYESKTINKIQWKISKEELMAIEKIRKQSAAPPSDWQLMDIKVGYHFESKEVGLSLRANGYRETQVHIPFKDLAKMKTFAPGGFSDWNEWRKTLRMSGQQAVFFRDKITTTTYKEIEKLYFERKNPQPNWFKRALTRDYGGVPLSSRLFEVGVVVVIGGTAGALTWNLYDYLQEIQPSRQTALEQSIIADAGSLPCPPKIVAKVPQG